MEVKKNKILFNVVLIVVCILVGAGGMVLYFHFNPASIQEVTNITKTEKEVTVTDSGIADAVEKVYDSVVVVTTYVNDAAYASGTGFAYKSEDGTTYLLTNYHVINGCDSVKVTLTNGNVIDAKLLGGDKYADVAVLTVDADDLSQVVEIGNNEDMRVGDTVFAIGSPIKEAYYWSVTRGILSGKDRTVTVSLSSNTSDTSMMNVMQTDVAINSGNSGGPLSNSNGEVIGITSSKVTITGVEGIGFAIPIEDAMEIADKVTNGEEIKRPYIGINMVEQAVAKYYGKSTAETNTGVYVTSVEENSGADKAGMVVGDTIVKLGDNDISSIADFRYYLYKCDIGDEVKMVVIRDGSEKTLTVKLGSK